LCVGFIVIDDQNTNSIFGQVGTSTPLCGHKSAIRLKIQVVQKSTIRQK
jgi:hypothetical protein